MKEKLIIAHRGDTTSAVENTIESFRNAVRKGADMIECDVRRTKDGLLVLHHLETVRDIPIRDLTWNDILKFNKKNGFEIHRLEDAVKSAAKKIKLDIELKEGGYENQVLSLAKRHLSCDEFIVTSFNDASIKTIKSNHPEVKAGLLLGVDSSRGMSPAKLAKLLFLRNIKATGADFLVPHWSLMKLRLFRRIKKCGKPLFVWTVNNKKMMQQLLRDDAVRGIITDKVEVAVALKNSLAQ